MAKSKKKKNFRNLNKGERAGQIVKNSKKSEVRYRKELNALIVKMNETVRNQLAPALFALEREYIADGYAEDLAKIMDNMELNFNGINREAQIIATSFVSSVATVNKERFYRAMNSVVGIDLSRAIQNEDLTNVLQSATRANVKLIRTIPAEYFSQIEQIVYNGTTKGNNARSMIDQILGVKNQAGQSTTSKKAFNRAKLIARDQTAKLNATITQQRNEKLGIEEYMWVTSRDERVRATHKANDGKIFRWDSPPPTGHPTEEINCRCFAKSIIKIQASEANSTISNMN